MKLLKHCITISLIMIMMFTASVEGALPIEKIPFSTRAEKKYTALEWFTEREKDNLDFKPGRGIEGDSMCKTIASYQTHRELKGHGNASSRTEYQFVDSDVQVGQTCSYRLSDVDIQDNVTLDGLLTITRGSNSQEELSDQNQNRINYAQYRNGENNDKITSPGIKKPQYNKAKLTDQYHRIRKLLSPDTRRKASIVVQEFKRRVFSFDATGDISQEAIIAVRNQFGNLSVPEEEILVFHVLGCVAEGMNDEIGNLQSEDEITSQTRQKMHDLINDLNAWLLKAGDEHADSPIVQELRTLLNVLNRRLDSLDQASGEIALKLQINSDRRSKLLSTLSQLIKKSSTTKDFIISNIK